MVTNVVNKGATFKCPHAGTGLVAVSTDTLTVAGDPILTIVEAASMTIIGCTHIHPAPVNGTPCLVLLSVSPGSSILKKNSIAVSLDSDTYTTDAAVSGVPIGATITISSTQTKLRA